jgi:xanthine dehydrogenase YagT iron-sulfur-binding subunit
MRKARPVGVVRSWCCCKETPMDANVSAPRDTRSPSPSPSPPDAAGRQHCAIALHVNGTRHELTVEPWVTLLDLLRDGLGLTGTKKGCDHGQCGACTVLVEGTRINACLTLAVMHNRARITTIEGLARGDELHPLQRAFVAHDALQCGYCTPGQICSALGLIDEAQACTVDDVRELMSGNICRCGAYPQILDAVCEVALERKP